MHCIRVSHSCKITSKAFIKAICSQTHITTRCPSSLISPSFFPFLCFPTQPFFPLWNGDLSGKPEFRPALYSPTDWAQAYSMTTATVQRPPPSTPLPVEHSIAFSIKVSVKLSEFPARISAKWPLDGTMYLWITTVNGVLRTPPFLF